METVGTIVTQAIYDVGLVEGKADDDDYIHETVKMGINGGQPIEIQVRRNRDAYNIHTKNFGLPNDKGVYKNGSVKAYYHPQRKVTSVFDTPRKLLNKFINI